jgi:hypothetical protein
MAARLLSVLVLALVLLSMAAPPAAHARTHVFIGVGPVFPYYPAYYWPPPYAYPPPYVWAPVPTAPPPGWSPGQWERHYDRYGRPYDVWVPPHLR